MTWRAGTVTNVKEACAWLSYTYLFVRMLKNPLAYGVPWEEIASDPRLEGHRKTLITTAARQLEKWDLSSAASIFLWSFWCSITCGNVTPVSMDPEGAHECLCRCILCRLLLGMCSRTHI